MSGPEIAVHRGNTARGTGKCYAGELPNATIDWVKWTPALVFSGNKGRLTVSCPGSIIHDVAQRDADQAEWEDACKFKYGRG